MSELKPLIEKWMAQDVEDKVQGHHADEMIAYFSSWDDMEIAVLVTDMLHISMQRGFLPEVLVEFYSFLDKLGERLATQ